MTKSQRANERKCNLRTCRKRPSETGKWEAREQLYRNHTNYLAKTGVSDSRERNRPNQELSCDRQKKEPHTKKGGGRFWKK